MKLCPFTTHPGHTRIALLTRFPVTSRVKTRLIPAIGGEGATALHRLLTERVASEILALSATREAEVEIWHDGGTPRQMRAWLGKMPHYRQQPRGDLGRRLFNVFDKAFHEGVLCCVAVGSDCPSMTADHLREALSELNEVDLVFGPATDGGYWMIGMNATTTRVLPYLFAGIEWGSSRVLQQSLAHAKQQNLRVSLLEELVDIDRPEDLIEWTRNRDPLPEMMRISIVIPTLNEETIIRNAIVRACESGMTEVVVADGGSSDATCEIAASAGAKVTKSPRGRARQLNFGASHTTGDVILFLHADTNLPPCAATLVKNAFTKPEIVGGAFAHSASAAGSWHTLPKFGSRRRYEVSKHPCGNLELFLRARTFRALSGFPDIPVMEDWELVDRLRKLGKVIVWKKLCEKSGEERGGIALKKWTV